MSSAEEELIRFFREQVKLEEEIVESMGRSLETITNSVAKGVLKGISLDSLKHAEIYKATVEVASVPQALTEEEFYRLKQDVKRHIEIEERMIRRLKKAIEDTKKRR